MSYFILDVGNSIVNELIFIASLLATQRRLAHTDIQWPDFTDYRHNAVKDPKVSSKNSAASRKSFTYLVTASKYTF